MKNRTIVALNNSLFRLKGYAGVDFNFGIAKNVQILKPVIEPLYEVQKQMADKRKPYSDDYNEAALQFSSKTTEGVPIMKEHGYDVTPENAKLFTQKIEELKIKHKEILDAIKVDEEAYEKLLDKEAENIVLHMIAYENLPANLVTEDMIGIIEIIDNKK